MSMLNECRCPCHESFAVRETLGWQGLHVATCVRTNHFDAHDTRDIPGYNSLKAAWDKPLACEDPLVEEERRLLSVAQAVRDWLRAEEQRTQAELQWGFGPEGFPP